MTLQQEKILFVNYILFNVVDNLILKGNPSNIVCQNINFLKGGEANVWKKSNDNFGLEIHDPNFNPENKKAKKVIKIKLIFQ